MPSPAAAGPSRKKSKNNHNNQPSSNKQMDDLMLEEDNLIVGGAASRSPLYSQSSSSSSSLSSSASLSSFARFVRTDVPVYNFCICGDPTCTKTCKGINNLRLGAMQPYKGYACSFKLSGLVKKVQQEQGKSVHEVMGSKIVPLLKWIVCKAIEVSDLDKTFCILIDEYKPKFSEYIALKASLVPHRETMVDSIGGSMLVAANKLSRDSVAKMVDWMINYGSQVRSKDCV